MRKKGRGKEEGEGKRGMGGGREEGRQDIKLKNGRVGNEIKLVATLYTPADQLNGFPAI